MKTNKTSKCILEGNGRKYEITAEIFFDEENEFDEGELFFRHVMTDQLCNSAEQTLSGWSEQDETDNKNWRHLVNEINEDDMLKQKIFDEMEEIEYYNYIKYEGEQKTCY